MQRTYRDLVLGHRRVTSAHTFGTSAGKPQGLTQQSSLSAFLFLTSHLPDGSTLEQTPHSSEEKKKTERGGVGVISSCGSGFRWTGRERRDREEKTGRGKPRYRLADFLLCRANADSSCPLPWFSGVSSPLR